MKRIFSFIAACATMFALAACQEELQQPVEQPVVPGVEGELQEVTFSVNIPQDPQTKAISDGMKATNLEYAVYRAEAYSYTDEAGKTETYPAGEYIPALSQGANAKVTEMHSTDQLKWEVVLTLAKNVKYDIVFWAYADDAPYTFDEAKATITVDDNYTGPANAENRDAFFFRCDDYAVITSDTKVELRRPFAQINFGSSDYDPYITDLHLKMTSTFDTDAHAAKDAVYENDDPNGRLLYPAVPFVGATKLPTVLNVLDGTVSGEAVVNFATTPIPYETGDQVLMVTDADGDETTTADQTTYHWMAMNYVLAGEEATINNIHAVFTYNNQDLEINVPNVPFKRNYKTNILGNLFTGEAKFNVIVVPAYYEPDYIYDMDLTLAEAFTQNRDVEFTLTEDTVIEEPLILENGKTLTLNLDEYSITTETDLWDAAKKVWSMISVRNKSTLVINSKGGKVVAKENDAYAIDVQGGSTVTINGGEFVGNISAVYVLDGTANINGGSYSIQQLSEPANGGDYRFTLNCEDAAYQAGNAVINVTGGSFVNFDPSNNLAEGAGTDFLADGYKAVSKKDNVETVYTVVELNPIEKAVAAGDKTVVLSEDLVLDETIEVESELEIDLGGKALSTETTPAFLANENLTIKNGTANVAKELVRVGAGVTVTLDDVTATSEGDNCVFVPKESKDAAVVVAEGTSLTSKGAAAIQSNGNTEGLDLTIAGTVVSEGDVAVYLPQVEKCTVASTAKITGVTGIEIRAGELVVEDGAEISAGNEFEAKANGNGSTIKGAAIAASAHSTNLSLSVTINGGTFNCAYALYETYLESAARTEKTTLAVKGGTFNAPIFSKNCEGFVTGGTFKDKPEEKYIAEGFAYEEGIVQEITVKKVTVAEFLAAAVSETDWYQLTGVITKVVNTTYGNFYIQDENGTEVYVYGLTETQVEKNNKTYANLGLEVGDVVTFNSLRSEHNGAAQAGGNTPAYYISHTDAVVTYGIVGTLNGWGSTDDIKMVSIYDKYHVAYNIDMTTQDAFKIRTFNDGNWSTSIGVNNNGQDGAFMPDAGFAAFVDGGSKNISVLKDGKYDVYYKDGNIYILSSGKTPEDITTLSTPVEPELKRADENTAAPGITLADLCVAGTFNGWSDTDMTLDGDWYVSPALGLNGDVVEFKFKEKNSWDKTLGGEYYRQAFVGNEYPTIGDNNNNIKAYGLEGSYCIYLAKDQSRFKIEKYVAPGESYENIDIPSDMIVLESGNTGTVNGISAYKVGTSSAYKKLTISSGGYKTISFYAAGWKGTDKDTITLTNATYDGNTSITMNDYDVVSGIQSNNFNLTVDSPVLYTIDVTDASSEVILSVKRGVVWGFTATK